MYNDKAKYRFDRGLCGQISRATFFGIKLKVDCVQHLDFYRTEVLCDLSLKDPLKNSWRQKSDQMLFRASINIQEDNSY